MHKLAEAVQLLEKVTFWHFKLLDTALLRALFLLFMFSYAHHSKHFSALGWSSTTSALPPNGQLLAGEQKPVRLRPVFIASEVEDCQQG